MLKNLLTYKKLLINLLVLAIIGFFLIDSAAVRRMANTNRGAIIRVALIDKVGDNLLFRGSDAVIRGKAFAIDELVERMKEAAQKNKIPFPKEFYLVDVSLLSIERGSLEIEERFFADNAHRGEFVNIPVFGILPSSGVNKYLASLSAFVNGISGLDNGSISFDIKAVETIRRQLTRRDKSIPIIVYVHCMAGCDRTGEVVAEYRLKFKKDISLAQAVEMNNKECGRPQDAHNIAAIKKFCTDILRATTKCELSSYQVKNDKK